MTGSPGWRALRSPARVVALLACAIAACSGGGASTSNKGIVQLVSAVGAPTVTYCTTISSPYQITYRVDMVNTTPNDVTITKVSSSGLVTQSSIASEVGMQVHMFDSLDFSPSVVTAHDQELFVTVTLNGPCTNHPPVTTDQFRDIVTTIYVTTNTGQYSVGPVSLHVIWQHL